MGGVAEFAALAALAAGTYSAVDAHENAHSAAHAAENERERQQKLMADRQAAVEKIREMYGVGGTPRAQENHGKLSQSIKDYYTAQLGANLRQADDQYAGASRVGRQNLARAGQLGSGLDASTRSSNLADFIRSRQRAVSDAAAGKSSLQARLTSQRLGLEGQVNSGAMTNPDYSGIAQQQRTVVDQARGQIVPQSVANLFDVAGNTYFNGRVQDAQGNTGLGAFFNNSGSGRTTARG